MYKKRLMSLIIHHPDSKVHVANMGPIWALSAPDGPHVGPMNLAIRVILIVWLGWKQHECSSSVDMFTYPHSVNNHSPVHLNTLSEDMSCQLSIAHWGRVMHMCVCKLTIVRSGNGMSPHHYLNQCWNIHIYICMYIYLLSEPVLEYIYVYIIRFLWTNS